MVPARAEHRARRAKTGSTPATPDTGVAGHCIAGGFRMSSVEIAELQAAAGEAAQDAAAAPRKT
ncbi:hypothetical protein, partial [Ralstonia pseudosolanacearum]|uniref:hypothetical protein n=1 Tax=Ralstonia pseudosolanacearum TaxID=1310165 RepID=UPI003CECFAE2